MRLVEEGRSALTDLGCCAAQTDHKRESKEHSPADQGGEVRFDGFGLLAARSKRTSRGRARSTVKQTKLARSVLEDFGC